MGWLELEPTRTTTALQTEPMKFDEVRFTIEEKCRYKRQVKDNKINNMKRTIEFKLCHYSWHCIFCPAYRTPDSRLAKQV